MKTENTFTDIEALEQELAEIAPLVRQAFSREGGPSRQVENAIRQEARSCAARKRNRLAWPAYRTLAAAAGFALLLGGAVQLHLVRQSGRNAQAARHILLDVRATQASTEHPVEGPTGLANRLLDIQGLDEEGFFKAEGEEPLWL